MTSRDFCYWLQGKLEIDGKPQALTPEQVGIIQKHLALVFKHEIDPSYGDEKHQKMLNEIHGEQIPICTELGPNGGGYRICHICGEKYEMLQDQVYHENCPGLRPSKAEELEKKYKELEEKLKKVPFGNPFSKDPKFRC